MKKVLAVLAALVVGLVMVAPVASASQNNDDKGGKNNCRQDNGRNDRSFNDDKGGKDDCKDDDGKDKPKPPPPPPPKPPVVTPVVVAPVFSGPKPIIQAYGIAEDPTCTLTPSWAKFSNVADGGWGKSWGPWLNGGKGGEACVRYIVYKKSKNAWEPSGSL